MPSGAECLKKLACTPIASPSAANARSAATTGAGSTAAWAAVARNAAARTRLEHFNRQLRVGVDANLSRDRHGLAGHGLGLKVGVHQRPRGGEREVAARADGGDAALRLQDVADAGDGQ